MARSRDTGVRFHQLNHSADHLWPLIRGESDLLAQSIFGYSLIRWAKPDGTFFLSASLAATQTGKSVRSCQRAIKRLQELGVWVLVGSSRGGQSPNGGGYANQYKINFLHKGVDEEANEELKDKVAPALRAAKRRKRE